MNYSYVVGKVGFEPTFIQLCTYRLEDVATTTPKIEPSNKSKEWLNKIAYSNRKVKNRPSKEELIQLLKTNSYCELGRKYGVSDNSIRKWIKNGVSNGS